MTLQHLNEIDLHLLETMNFGNDSLFADGFALATTCGWIWILFYVALAYLIIKNNETTLQILLAFGAIAICLLLTDTATEYFIKPAIGRLRPCNDPTIMQQVHLAGNHTVRSLSFFCGRAAAMMGVTIFIFLLVRNWLLSLTMLCWTILCGWAEIAIGLHFPSDILAAYLYGIVIACIIYIIYFYLYLKISPRLNYISTQYTKTGYSLTDINVVICTLLFSVGAAILYGIFLTTQI